MKPLLLCTLLFLNFPALSGTANCDTDSQCRHTRCSNAKKPRCDIILGTTGPKGKPMGFCKCIKDA